METGRLKPLEMFHFGLMVFCGCRGNCWIRPDAAGRTAPLCPILSVLWPRSWKVALAGLRRSNSFDHEPMSKHPVLTGGSAFRTTRGGSSAGAAKRQMSPPPKNGATLQSRRDAPERNSSARTAVCNYRDEQRRERRLMKKQSTEGRDKARATRIKVERK